jgi:hypothetical protein
VNLLDHWQTLVGSLLGAILGFAAAIWTVRTTLMSEERRAEREAWSIRRSLIAELRQFGLRALDGYHACNELSERPGDVSITELEMVFFYGSIDLVQQAFSRARDAYGPVSVPHPAIREVCRSLVDMCRALTEILPELTKDPKAHVSGDEQLLRSLGAQLICGIVDKKSCRASCDVVPYWLGAPPRLWRVLATKRSA